MSARNISEALPAEAPTVTSESFVVTPTHQLEGIELRSLAVFAALFYGAAFVALGIGIAVVWFFAWIVGLVGQFEEFMQSIGFRDFQLVGPRVIFGGLVLALALVVFLTVMTVLAAALYNVMASNGRTVRMRFGEAPPVTHEPPPARVDTESIPRALLRALRGSREASEHIAAMEGGGVPARLQR
jgi:Transmembrane domain of unknown function (DUF3566)